MDEKMKRKNGIIFGAVVIILVMASNAFGTDSRIPSLDNTLTSDIYVANEICLNADDLPNLREAVNQIDDIGTKELINKIIFEIEEDKIVTGNDIQMYVSDVQLSGNAIKLQGKEVTAIYAGQLCGEAPGEAWIPLGLKLIGPGGVLFLALVPHVILWKAIANGNMNILVHVGFLGSHEITTPHTGLGIGFVGSACNFVEGMIMNPWSWFSIIGECPCIIVT